MDFARMYERLSQGFHSTTEKLVFVVVVGGALAFVVYLLWDSLYHKWKWRRLSRKFRETDAHHKPGPPE